jgi:hypothetical protein
LLAQKSIVAASSVFTADVPLGQDTQPAVHAATATSAATSAAAAAHAIAGVIAVADAATVGGALRAAVEAKARTVSRMLEGIRQGLTPDRYDHPTKEKQWGLVLVRLADPVVLTNSWIM